MRDLSRYGLASICAGALALVVVAALTSFSSSAVAAPGSYSQSCNNVSTPGKDLKAQCKTKSGNWIWAYLQNTHLCASDIANHNGVLVCTRPPGVAGGPVGSYQQTCRDIHRSGVVLFATCKRKDGSWFANSTDSRCPGDISNEDGRLVCHPPKQSTAGNPGSSPYLNCKYIKAETKCYGAVKTCTHVFQCPTGVEKVSQGICGVCFGFW